METVKANAALQEQLKAEGADPTAIALEAGFQITKEDLMRHQQSQVMDLSDEGLEQIAGGQNAGGKNKCWTICIFSECVSIDN